jgi:flagellar hook-basal body complex protein FliE
MSITPISGISGLPPLTQPVGDLVKVATTNPLHLDAEGKAAGQTQSGDVSFENALLKAMDGVNAKQQDASQLTEKMLTDPDSVDAHQITIAQAEATLSLNIARTVLNRLVQGWKDVANTR